MLRIEGQHTLLYSDTFLFYQPILFGYLPVDTLVTAAAFSIRATAACLEQGFLMRGAISFGELLVSPSIPTVAGPAVIECAEHFESTEWVGCHATPSVAAILDMAPPDKNARHLEFYERAKVPFKLAGGATVSTETWVVKWHRHLRESLPGKHRAIFPGALRTRMDDYQRQGRPVEDAVTDHFRELLLHYVQNNPTSNQKVQNTLISLF